MPRIKVTFFDGSTIVVHEEQTFLAIKHIDKEGTPINPTTHQIFSSDPFGLVGSFIELLQSSLFFQDVENKDVFYSSNSVVKLEII